MNAPARLTIAKHHIYYDQAEKIGDYNSNVNLLESAFCSTLCNIKFMTWFYNNHHDNYIGEGNLRDAIVQLRRERCTTSDQCVICQKNVTMVKSATAALTRAWSSTGTGTGICTSNVYCTFCGESNSSNMISTNQFPKYYKYKIAEYLGQNIVPIRGELVIIPDICYKCFKCTGLVPNFNEHRERYLSVALAGADNTAALLALQDQKRSEFETVQGRLEQEWAHKFAELNSAEQEEMERLKQELSEKKSAFERDTEKFDREYRAQKDELNKRQQELTDHRSKLLKHEKEHLEICKKLEENIAAVQREILSLQEKDIEGAVKLQKLQDSIKANEDKVAALTKSKQDINNIEEYIKTESVRLRAVVQEAIGSSTKKIMRDANKILNDDLRGLASGAGGASGDHTKHSCPRCKKVYSRSVNDDEHFTELHVNLPCGHTSCGECKPDAREMSSCLYCKVMVKSTMLIK